MPGDPRPLKLREFLKRLRGLGVEQLPNSRGKGSEIILIRPLHPGSRKGPQYPIKNHGAGTEIHRPVIAAALRVLGIDPDEFWGKPD